MGEAYNAGDLGRAVRELRRRRRWTQAELADWLGVARRTVISLEAGGPVSVIIVMRALTLLGSKVVIVDKGEPANGRADG